MNFPDATAVMKAHYERQLAPVYTWMIGDVEAALERSRRFLLEAGVGQGGGGKAVDLGCGFGLHAIPLADLGFSVLALDLSSELLTELGRRRGDRDIRVVEADLRAFVSHLEGPVELVVCLGDTLTHLPDLDSVDKLLAEAAQALAPGGTLMLGFRDYVSVTLQGPQRFIPVRSDANRILTCFLEYQEGRVEVTDLVHQRAGDAWQLRASSYLKLRLDPAWVTRQLVEVGLDVVRQTVERGMVTVIARRRRVGIAA